MTSYSLSDLGWSDHFAHQLDDSSADLTPARIHQVHRDRLLALSPGGPVALVPSLISGAYAVGDWVLSDGATATHLLEPRSDLARRAAGHSAERQRIAANIDTIAVVTSCNADFNIARLERYLAMIASADCLPLVVLTKADQTDDPLTYQRAAERLSPLVTALTLNAKDPEDVARLIPWCSDGQTLALVGSSGVGKTTLRNGLTGEDAATAGIREDDARGRHTTTFRALVRSQHGGWLIDTPGMRELQLTDASDGIEAVFEDIEELATQCRFSDCAHQSEPGCAVRAALEDGTLDADRMARWDKLRREDAFNSQTLAQSRAKNKAFGKMVKQAQASGRRKRRGQG